jgi:hypothetical protein
MGDAVGEDSKSGETSRSACVGRLIEGWRSSGASSSVKEGEEGEEGGTVGSSSGSVRFRVVTLRMMSSREGRGSVGRRVGFLAIGSGVSARYSGEGGGGWVVDARLRFGIDGGGTIDCLRLGCGKEREGLRTGGSKPEPESDPKELEGDDVGSCTSSGVAGTGETNESVRLGCGLINEGLRSDAFRSKGAGSTSLGMSLATDSGDLPLIGVDLLGDGVVTLLSARCVAWATGAGM